MITPSIVTKYVTSRNMLVQISHYLFTVLFIRGVQVLITPVMTRLLPPGEFGYSVLFLQSVNLIAGVAVFGTAASFAQVYMKQREQFVDTVKSCLVFLAVVNVLLMPVYAVAAHYLARFFDLPPLLMYFAFPLGIGVGFYSLLSSYLIASQRSMSANRYTIINFTGAGLLFIVFLLAGERTYLARVYSYALIVLILLAATIKAFYPYYVHGKFSRERLRYALRFGVPTILSGVSYVMFSYADRMILTRYRGAAEMGIYSFACVIGFLPMLLSGSVLSAYSPHFYDMLGEDQVVKIKRLAHKMTLAMLFLCLFVTLTARPLARILAGEDYRGALDIIPVLALYSFFNFALSFTALYIMYREGTKMLAIAYTGAAALNILLNFLFIPRFGYVAAAWTTLASGAVQYIFVAVLVRVRLGITSTGGLWNMIICAVYTSLLILWTWLSS